MNENVTKSAGQVDGWWSTPAKGWAEASEAVFKRWHRYERATIRVEDAVARTALAFGFGARGAYGEHRAWDDLTEQLEVDWQQAGLQKRHPWATVHNIVKEGWEASAAIEEPIRGPSMAAEPRAVVPPSEVNVPGGRPDRNNE